MFPFCQLLQSEKASHFCSSFFVMAVFSLPYQARCYADLFPIDAHHGDGCVTKPTCISVLVSISEGHGGSLKPVYVIRSTPVRLRRLPKSESDYADFVFGGLLMDRRVNWEMNWNKWNGCISFVSSSSLSWFIESWKCDLLNVQKLPFYFLCFIYCLETNPVYHSSVFLQTVYGPVNKSQGHFRSRQQSGSPEWRWKLQGDVKHKQKCDSASSFFFFFSFFLRWGSERRLYLCMCTQMAQFASCQPSIRSPAAFIWHLRCVSAHEPL